LGWLGPGGCSFGLPVPPRHISLVRQGCYRALPMGWRAARTLPPFGTPPTMIVRLVVDIQNRLFWRVGTGRVPVSLGIGPIMVEGR